MTKGEALGHSASQNANSSALGQLCRGVLSIVGPDLSFNGWPTGKSLLRFLFAYVRAAPIGLALGLEKSLGLNR